MSFVGKLHHQMKKVKDITFVVSDFMKVKVPSVQCLGVTSHLDFLAEFKSTSFMPVTEKS